MKIKDNCVACGKKIKVTKIGKQGRYRAIGNYCWGCSGLCRRIVECKVKLRNADTDKELDKYKKRLQALIARAKHYTYIPKSAFENLTNYYGVNRQK